MDVDANRHLHNTRYLEWLLNAVPDELFTRQRPISLGVKFRHEVKGGDSLMISSRLREDGVWLHEAGRDSDGKVVATGFSVWGPPQSAGIISAA
jgi:acyl-ACP thioesterase